MPLFIIYPIVGFVINGWRNWGLLKALTMCGNNLT